MNERIKLLWEQANTRWTCDYALSGKPREEWRSVPDLFAELIVRECAEQIIAKGTDWVDFTPSQTGVRPEYWDMAQQIKEHFGVKQ